MDDVDDDAPETWDYYSCDVLESDLLFTWDTKAGMDLATRHLLTDKCVWDYYGISVAKGAAKTILGAA